MDKNIYEVLHKQNTKINSFERDIHKCGSQFNSNEVETAFNEFRNAYSKLRKTLIAAEQFKEDFFKENETATNFDMVHYMMENHIYVGF